jgi:hypothetical protein
MWPRPQSGAGHRIHPVAGICQDIQIISLSTGRPRLPPRTLSAQLCRRSRSRVEQNFYSGTVHSPVLSVHASVVGIPLPLSRRGASSPCNLLLRNPSVCLDNTSMQASCWGFQHENHTPCGPALKLDRYKPGRQGPCRSGRGTATTCRLLAGPIPKPHHRRPPWAPRPH